MDPERRVLDGGSVVIHGDRIEAVLEAGDAIPAANEIVDATGHLVIPGSVNTHGHIPMVLLRGLADDLSLMEWLEDYIFPAEGKNVSPEFVYWGSLLACIEMARSGTTTFTDMYYFEEEVARATDEAGLRGVLSQTIIGFPAPDYKTPEEALTGTENFIRQYLDHPRVVPGVGPHALYTTSLEVVENAYRLAQRYEVPFQIHALAVASVCRQYTRSCYQRGRPQASVRTSIGRIARMDLVRRRSREWMWSDAHAHHFWRQYTRSYYQLYQTPVRRVHQSQATRGAGEKPC